ncbi:MAG: DUF998 domain-containing protein [Gammaproteobacteria bacterium]|nr:DUF998 domain-containing protein [Gammaproteobacteria bacterium]
MRKVLLLQVAYLPVCAMALLIAWAFFVPHYSSVSQHLSELQLLEHPIALATRFLPVVVGLSIMVFGIAVLIHDSPRMPFTGATALVFGAANASNGLFVAGDPRHGLYGLAMFFILVPACYAGEIGSRKDHRLAINLSLATSVFLLIYTWLQFSGLDPHGYRGLTQRIAVLVIFGWYTFAAFELLKGFRSKTS